VVVRSLEDGYELISGHRRTHAAKIAGFMAVPAVIRELNDDEATVLMVDANIQRDEILPSERAHSLKMKIDAINRLYKHGDRKCVRSRDIAGEEAGLSGRQVQRYLNLNDLNQGFLDMVDDKKIQMGLGLEIASMRPEVQQWLYECVEMGSIINSDIVSKLKRVDETEGLDEDVINCILNEQEQRPKSRKITLSERKLNKYFSEMYTIEEIESILYNLLDQWKRTIEGEYSDE
jgi:ParB family chromosome partitioning protein